MEAFFRKIAKGDFLPSSVTSLTNLMPGRLLGPEVPVEPKLEAPVLRRSERIKAMMEKKRQKEEELKKAENSMTEDPVEQKPKIERLSRRSSKTHVGHPQQCSCCGVDLVLVCPTCDSRVNPGPSGSSSGAGKKRKRNDEERQSKRRNLGVSSPKPPPVAQPKKKAKKAAPPKRSH
ncbi:hypothetical protein KR026_010930 [Drosophila bipectinata]|nr:hypothetical protein KR026_010930 [Drosophila bipectinata]